MIVSHPELYHPHAKEMNGTEEHCTLICLALQASQPAEGFPVLIMAEGMFKSLHKTRLVVKLHEARSTEANVIRFCHEPTVIASVFLWGEVRCRNRPARASMDQNVRTRIKLRSTPEGLIQT
jgi:hypothetical protein